MKRKKKGEKNPLCNTDFSIFDLFSQKTKQNHRFLSIFALAALTAVAVSGGWE
jgi:hypothetical protein